MLKKFEVGVFNKEVRDAVQDGTHHRFLDDEWADIHWIEIVAQDEQEAQQKANRRYPERAGYLITGVQALE
jgi:hypothetical protein